MNKVVARSREPYNRQASVASRRRAVQRKRILTAAEKLFTDKPYRAVTMDRVAQTAGVAKGTLYLYFPSKEALYLRLPNAGLDALFRTLESSFAPNVDVVTRLRRAIELTLQFYDQHPDLLSLLAAGEPPVAAQRLIERSRERGLEFFRSLIEDGSQAGVFRKGDSRLAALVILGAIRSVLLHYGSTRAREELSRDLDQLLLRSLVADALAASS